VFENTLEVLKFLGLDQFDSIKLLSGNAMTGKHALLHNPDEFAIYSFDKDDFNGLKFSELVRNQYPSIYNIWLIWKENGSWQKKPILPEELIKANSHENFFIFFEPLLKNASLVQFRELIALLRSPEGCPWDRKQTHKTLRTNLLEETYEVLGALDQGDTNALREELGDLLLQIILHAQIASENNNFNIFDVINSIFTKIVDRHPHVFQGTDIDDADDVIRNWEILKQKERETNGGERGILSSVPTNLPALSLAQKYQERAARVGFDWQDIQPVFEKIDEELKELKDAENDLEKGNELGDLLFAVVNLVRWYGFNAESLLREMSIRFKHRFEFIELQAANQGKHLYELTLDEMDTFWEQAKLDEAKAA